MSTRVRHDWPGGSRLCCQCGGRTPSYASRAFHTACRHSRDARGSRGRGSSSPTPGCAIPGGNLMGRQRRIQVEELRCLVASGLTDREIARQLGTSQGYIWELRRKYRLGPSRHAIAQKAPADEVRLLAADGLSQAAIARALDVSRERIRQICNKHGIETVSGRHKTPRAAGNPRGHCPPCNSPALRRRGLF